MYNHNYEVVYLDEFPICGSQLKHHGHFKINGSNNIANAMDSSNYPIESIPTITAYDFAHFPKVVWWFADNNGNFSVHTDLNPSIITIDLGFSSPTLDFRVGDIIIGTNDPNAPNLFDDYNIRLLVKELPGSGSTTWEFYIVGIANSDLPTTA